MCSSGVGRCRYGRLPLGAATALEAVFLPRIACEAGRWRGGMSTAAMAGRMVALREGA